MRALQIVDSAVVVGNLSAVWGDFLRARIYSQSVADGQQIDSLLGGPDRVRFDSARVIGERLSPRNLRRLFVDRYGITPTEYRQGLQTI